MRNFSVIKIALILIVQSAASCKTLEKSTIKSSPSKKSSNFKIIIGD